MEMVTFAVLEVWIIVVLQLLTYVMELPPVLTAVMNQRCYVEVMNIIEHAPKVIYKLI